LLWLVITTNVPAIDVRVIHANAPLKCVVNAVLGQKTNYENN